VNYETGPLGGALGEGHCLLVHDEAGGGAMRLLVHDEAGGGAMRISVH